MQICPSPADHWPAPRSAALALAIPAGPAAADGLPLPVEESPNGVASPDGASRYLTVTLGGRTAVLAQQAATGAVTSRVEAARALRDPARRVRLVGRRPVGRRAHARAHPPARGVPAPHDDVRRAVDRGAGCACAGPCACPATSATTRCRATAASLFLINYISPTDPTKYRVRVYDLVRNRLDPKPIVDPREEPDEMNGFPLSRAS